MDAFAMTPTEAGIAAAAVIFAPATLIFALSEIANLSLRYWRGRMVESKNHNGRNLK